MPYDRSKISLGHNSDIAITETGPILIEGNNDPGYTGFQYPMFTNGHGGKDLYARFLN